eukprot:g73716.t1
MVVVLPEKGCFFDPNQLKQTDIVEAKFWLPILPEPEGKNPSGKDELKNESELDPKGGLNAATAYLTDKLDPDQQRYLWYNLAHWIDVGQRSGKPFLQRELDFDAVAPATSTPPRQADELSAEASPVITACLLAAAPSTTTSQHQLLASTLEVSALASGKSNPAASTPHNHVHVSAPSTEVLPSLTVTEILTLLTLPNLNSPHLILKDSSNEYLALHYSI